MAEEDLYPNPEGMASPAAPPSSSKDDSIPESSALVPTSLLGSGEIEPGRTFTVKVVHVYGDEAEIAIVRSKPKKESMTPEEELDDMSEEGY